MVQRIVLLGCAVILMTLVTFATDKPATTSPAALEHSQAVSLKVSLIPAKAEKAATCDTADRSCCCSIGSGCNGYGCLICGCSFCPFDKQPDSTKSIHPNSHWRVPELIETLR